MKTVHEGGQGEIVEKKSRFIATVRPVDSEEEAIEFIAEMKKKYWDARHNCSAFVIGRNQELSRCSDDGEPSQTAGRPMLDVLLREGIHNAAVVVTRYFGGVLLGTGGLVRAYQKAVQEGLANSVVIDRKPGRELCVQTDYNGFGRIQYILGQQGIAVLGTEYAEDVKVSAVVPCEKEKLLTEAVTDGTGGKAQLLWGRDVEYAVIGKETKVFSQS